jgi:hypothetical protein
MTYFEVLSQRSPGQAEENDAYFHKSCPLNVENTGISSASYSTAMFDKHGSRLRIVLAAWSFVQIVCCIVLSCDGQIVHPRQREQLPLLAGQIELFRSDRWPKILEKRNCRSD